MVPCSLFMPGTLFIFVVFLFMHSFHRRMVTSTFVHVPMPYLMGFEFEESCFREHPAIPVRNPHHSHQWCIFRSICFSFTGLLLSRRILRSIASMSWSLSVADGRSSVGPLVKTALLVVANGFCFELCKHVLSNVNEMYVTYI